MDTKQYTMTQQKRTPGVYIQELDAFGNSVVAVPTAIPAFVGYTQKATRDGQSLTNVPTYITSMAEFEMYFGSNYQGVFELQTTAASDELSDQIQINDTAYQLTPDTSATDYLMYRSLQFFYANGGGEAVILSVGDYASSIAKEQLMAGIDLLKTDSPADITLLVVPDTVSRSLPQQDCYNVQQHMITHCASMQDRFTILDIYNGDQPLENGVIADFRDQVYTPDPASAQYSAAYYPWMHTTLSRENNFSFTNLKGAGSATESESISTLITMIEAELDLNAPDLTPQQSELKAEVETLRNPFDNPPTEAQMADISKLDSTLSALSPGYRDITLKMTEMANIMPVSAAMAGVYTAVDNARGVWQAPANVGLASTTKPAIEISTRQQEDLNVPVNGKAVNAIRSFPGQGTLVWGARTLLGNSNDWRYINVRRTMIFLEQSIKAAARAFVFEPNTPNTWTTVKSMIDNFLSNQWKAGALVGSSPEAAYQVSIGLGSTMTQDDISNGIMRITVLVAPSRPAEYIEITFEQQMQQS